MRNGKLPVRPRDLGAKCIAGGRASAKAGVGAAPGPVGAAAVGDPALVAPAAPLMPGK